MLFRSVKVKSLSRVQLLATPWTAAHQAPPSIGFSRQEYWSGMPLPSPKSHFSLSKMGIITIASYTCVMVVRLRGDMHIQYKSIVV